MQDTGSKTQNETPMKKFLFVCTGNTCRSPMAEAVFNKKTKDLGIDSVAFSRGLFADGSPVSDNAVAALSKAGIPNFHHISKTVSEDDIKEADYIIGISSRHTSNLISTFPQYCDKMFAFPFDISDPFGGNLDIYKKTLCEIEKGIDIIICEVFPKCQ